MSASIGSRRRQPAAGGPGAAARGIALSLIAAMCVVLLGGCDDATAPSVGPAGPVEKEKGSRPFVAPSPYQYMSFAVWRIDRPYVSTYGPAGAGYRGTGFFADDGMPDAHATWLDINDAGYTATWMAVRRDWLSSTPVDWARVDEEISFAVANHADYLSVDDVLSPASYGGAVITDDTMREFGRRVHLRGKKVAAADNDNIQGLLADHPHLLDSVDVFMPYGYNRTLTQLQAYFGWARAHCPGKAIVPVLGYHVRDVNPPYRFLPDQLGVESGQTGFIEVAQSFAAMNADPGARVVFYYYEPDSPWPATFDAAGGLKTYLDSLTVYLHRYNYVLASSDPRLTHPG